MRRLVITLATAGAAILAAPAVALATPEPGSAAASVAADFWVPMRNWRSTKCLEQSWANGSEQPNIKAVACTGGDNQQWAFTGVNGSSVIMTVKNKKSGKCLEQSWANGSEQPDVKAAACNGGSNQQWRIRPAEYYVTGYFLENVSSGKVLQQSFANGSEQPDVNVAAINVWGDYRNQVWRH
ncbi:RICIN domain-containing protein [Actinoplanes teichomyceticus]|uniref:Ricin-type beta-trefoil lectin protein n=1 Tax=Actinoplanes teichomyceticus TaxID=1867 RepID=A0A561VFW7_ACTTI|nr:RICIN domain-containing protein [Actinoplanes teichomyceticus]TWG10520.1 ricin-type beta-trefoil lectin protein [Actinoplanes teichomyceticus]GIF15291.1 hypothetical protein Ate01nite_53230 [Actinoplanes teichomyceticus]